MPETNFRALCAALVDEAPYESPTTCLARAALAQPEPVAPTDEELARRFRVWWHDEGSLLPPLPGMDHEEHVRRISEIAWANGAYVARYGTPENEPVAPTDEELLKLLSRASGLPGCDTYIVDGGRIMSEPNELLAFARAVLACYGTPANNTSEEILCD
jgi:hypothetical protein